MKVSQVGVDLIKRYVKFQATACQNDTGVWMIGWGTSTDVKPGDVVSLVEADALLQRDLTKLEAQLAKIISVPHVQQNEFDALASFAYYLGLENLEHSDLLLSYNAGMKAAATAAFMQHISAGHRNLMSLVLRRRDEAVLFAGND
jgi:lysozyme